ncbi:MAG: helix-turn-helix transcriptional regulator [Clostridia bacterium]|nr:helix-turn-helix transcriptional regulator [Clostridia bacterium]
MVKNLKMLRNQMGISQQGLADALGISQQSVNRYENHKVEPDIDTLIKIADFFGGFGGPSYRKNRLQHSFRITFISVSAKIQRTWQKGKGLC